jgi:hypothetical protein
MKRQRLSADIIDIVPIGNANDILNPSCHLLKSMGFCLTLTVKSPISPQEERAHGRQNYRDVLPV